MADEKPSLQIDTDWKRQAQEEKRKLVEQQKQREQASTTSAPPGAATIPPGAAATVPEARARDPRQAARELPPASFATLVQSIVTQALFHLGDLAVRGGEPVVNLDMARHHIDTLSVLEEKTANNLNEDEKRILDSALYETRMRYVSVASQFISEPFQAPGMAMQFLDTSANSRLAIFSEMLTVIASGIEDPRELHRTLIGLMRRAFDVRCYAEISTEGLPPGSYRLTRAWREDGSEGVPDHSPWQIAGVPDRRGGALSELVSRGQATGVNQLNVPPDDPAFAELGAYKSVIAAPGGLGQWHNWVLVFDTRPDAFSADDVESLVLRVNLIALTLKNLKTLTELRSAKAVIDAEVDRIAQIQRSLLPPDRPEVPGMEVAARFETFDRAGGDLYDYAELSGGRWGFGVSDASGHGPSAAVVSAMLNAIFHTLAQDYGGHPPTLVDVLQTSNIQMVARCIEQSFVTAFLCVWNPADRTLTYARAGHHPPVLRRGDKASLLNAVGDLPLGIFAETKFSEHVEPMQSGDVIVIYTDGVTETFNDKAEMFGEEKLIETILSTPADASAEEVLKAVWDAVTTHRAGGTPRDDQTVLVLRVK